MATDRDPQAMERKRQKERDRNEAKKRAKAKVEKPHPKKGVTTRASASTPRAAGRKSRPKGSPGEQGAHGGKHRE